MKTIKYIASLLAGITLFSCDNFEDINTNPDAVTKVSPKLLATGCHCRAYETFQRQRFHL